MSHTVTYAASALLLCSLNLLVVAAQLILGRLLDVEIIETIISNDLHYILCKNLAIVIVGMSYGVLVGES